MRAAHNSKHIKARDCDKVETGILPEPVDPPPQERNEVAEGRPPAKSNGFERVPTHVVAVVNERRAYPRAALSLPLRLKRVADQREPQHAPLLTKNISSSGVYFLYPTWIDPGTPIELEVSLVERPLGRGSVRITTAARVVRTEPTETAGWHGLAAIFDDISFQRDEAIPERYAKP